MKKSREGSLVYLIDIGYSKSMNGFYEFFGENILYSLIEQESYIDLKEMVYDLINDKIKFRKHERNGMILTLKVEMTEVEKEKFNYLLEKGQFRFFHDYEIKAIKIFKPEEDE